LRAGYATLLADEGDNAAAARALAQGLQDDVTYGARAAYAARADDKVLLAALYREIEADKSPREGKRLYLLGTGTDLAPFMSIIRDPETYEVYDQVVLAHGARTVDELGYSDYIQHELPQHEYRGEQVREKLRYYPTVTRETFTNQGRLTELLRTGKMCRDLGLPDLHPEHDRVMLCGNPSMLDELVIELEARGFVEGATHEPGDYTIERAFVER